MTVINFIDYKLPVVWRRKGARQLIFGNDRSKKPVCHIKKECIHMFLIHCLFRKHSRTSTHRYNVTSLIHLIPTSGILLRRHVIPT